MFLSCLSINIPAILILDPVVFHVSVLSIDLFQCLHAILSLTHDLDARLGIQQRADALQQYLLSNSPISPVNLTALGYGESRPVASNENGPGRAQNRRIDVVIYPKW